jgi:cbb3-type cytochrome oxidase subunit 3
VDGLSDPSTWGPFVEVIRVAFVICLGMCIVGMVVSWFRGTIPKEFNEC